MRPEKVLLNKFNDNSFLCCGKFNEWGEVLELVVLISHVDGPAELLPLCLIVDLLKGDLELLAPGHGDPRVEVVELGGAESDLLVLLLVGPLSLEPVQLLQGPGQRVLLLLQVWKKRDRPGENFIELASSAEEASKGAPQQSPITAVCPRKKISLGQDSNPVQSVTEFPDGHSTKGTIRHHLVRVLRA